MNTITILILRFILELVVAVSFWVTVHFIDSVAAPIITIIGFVALTIFTFCVKLP